MRVRVCSGRTVAFNGNTFGDGSLIDAPDDVAEQWIVRGDAKATLRSKPIAAPRPLAPNQSIRSEGK